MSQSTSKPAKTVEKPRRPHRKTGNPVGRPPKEFDEAEAVKELEVLIEKCRNMKRAGTFHFIAIKHLEDAKFKYSRLARP